MIQELFDNTGLNISVFIIIVIYYLYRRNRLVEKEDSKYIYILIPIVMYSVKFMFNQKQNVLNNELPSIKESSSIISKPFSITESSSSY